MIHISSAFDSGNIVVEDAGDPSAIRLSIRQDARSDFYQWFHFRLSGGAGHTVGIRIVNAGGAAFVGGWEDYGVCASYDREAWFRIPTTYEDGELRWSHVPDHDIVHYAYFPPYSRERHLDLVAGAQISPLATHRVLGHTVHGRDMDALAVGEGPLCAWVIARQHPGEAMAEWWMEGFLARLLDEDAALAAEARSLMRFHIVPNMNPDGSVMGHLRTNAVGANLNREWNIATAERSPEVLCVREAMDADPPALCLDVHGDEALPYNFIAGAEGIPGHTDDQAAQLALFLDAYKAATPEFQTARGYAKTAPGKANLSMCTNYTAHAYGGLAMTLEMPFKDNAEHPDPQAGWSIARCRSLGHDALEAMVVWARSRRAG